jgi:hypothetical protein
MQAVHSPEAIARNAEVEDLGYVYAPGHASQPSRGGGQGHDHKGRRPGKPARGKGGGGGGGKRRR